MMKTNPNTKIYLSSTLMSLKMELFTMVNGNMDKDMEKVPKFGKMVLTTKVTGPITKPTEKED